MDLHGSLILVLLKLVNLPENTIFTSTSSKNSKFTGTDVVVSKDIPKP